MCIRDRVKRANILSIHYEDLKNAHLRRETLNEISDFLGLTVNDTRLECVLRNPYTKFQRKEKKCLGDKGLERNKNKTTRSSFEGNDSYRTTKEIFKTKHKIWINSAINRVYIALVMKFGLRSKDSRLLKYKNSIVKAHICQRYHGIDKDT